jgi:hypothetical protein
MDYVNDTIKNMAVTWRNRDLSRPLSEEQVDYFSNLAVQTPTKQENKYYNVFSITNQELIDKIYYHTAVPDPGPAREQPYNPQVIAPLLLIWFSTQIELGIRSMNYLSNAEKEKTNDLIIDTHQAVGISAGVVSYEANRLGLQTGFCRCIHDGEVRRELQRYGHDLTDASLLLTLSIGYGDSENPRQHQKLDYMIMQPHERINPQLIKIN